MRSSDGLSGIRISACLGAGSRSPSHPLAVPPERKRLNCSTDFGKACRSGGIGFPRPPTWPSGAGYSRRLAPLEASTSRKISTGGSVPQPGATGPYMHPRPWSNTPPGRICCPSTHNGTATSDIFTAMPAHARWDGCVGCSAFRPSHSHPWSRSLHVARSRRLSGPKQRLQAFWTLVNIRMYRAGRMLRALRTEKIPRVPPRWNRP